MKNSITAEKLFDAVSDIDPADVEDFVRYDEKQPEVRAKAERPVLKMIGGIAACIVLFGGLSVGLKLLVSRTDPEGPGTTSTEADNTVETNEIQVTKHVYKNEAPYAKLKKYEFAPEEQSVADRLYDEMIKEYPEFADIPREKLWESLATGEAGEYAWFGFCIGEIGTDYCCNYNNFDYGIQEYNDYLNGWKISGEEFRQFVDLQLSQTVNDAILEMLRKNVRAYAEKTGMQIVRWADRDPDDILERVGFHYDENGLYVQSVTLTDPVEPSAVSGHIYAAVGVEINGDTITLNEYSASSEPIFTTDKYEYSFTPNSSATELFAPYAKPEKTEFSADQRETVDRAYNEIIEKYPDFGKIPREMLLEEIYSADNNTNVLFRFCLGGVPTQYICSYSHNIGVSVSNCWISGEEFKPFTDWQIPEHSMGEIRSMLAKQTLLIMKAEKLDTGSFDRDKLVIYWSVDDDGQLYANSEYIASVTDETEKQFGCEGHAHVFNKVSVTISGNTITLREYPATAS